MRKLWSKYENWSKLETEQQLYRYNPKLYRYNLTKNDKKRNCTVQLQIVPVQLQIVPVQVTRNALKCVFSHIFPYVSTPINSTLQTPIKTTPKSSWNLFSFQFLFQFHIFLQKSIMDIFQNPSNMGYNPYTIANIRIS